MSNPEPEEVWFDNKTHSFDTQDDPEPEPGTLDYYRQGCDHLYTELGGES
jgi:hypothetical protein